MSNAIDRRYAARRLTEELGFAHQAAHPNAVAAHYELAYRYSLIAFEQQYANSASPISTTHRSPKLRLVVAPTTPQILAHRAK